MSEEQACKAGAAAVVALVAATLGLVPLSRAVCENWVCLHVLSGLAGPENAARFWRGAGLRSEDEEFKILLMRAYQAPADQGGCTENEKNSLDDALNGWTLKGVRGTPGRMTTLARARELACRNRAEEGLRVLEGAGPSSMFDPQRVLLLRRQGADDAAARIVLSHVCPSRECWCMWSVLGPSRLGGSAMDEGIWRASSGLGSGSRPSELQVLHLLEPRISAHVTAVRGAPLLVSGVVPRSEGDNYVEYETVPAASATVRFRIRGAVFGRDMVSCIVPRLVCWSSEKYQGEAVSQLVIKGRFEVEQWVALPDRTTAVTPRLTFDSACFSGGQRIAIGAADLAFGRPSR